MLEFGAGGNRPPGYRCFDTEADCDIRKPLPFKDGTVDKIRAEHLCEHMSGPEFLRFLDECYRILKPGGRVRICMPVLDRLDVVKARDIILNHGHQAAYTPALIVKFLTVAGFSVPTMQMQLPDKTDFHWKGIGRENDLQETFRVEGVKP